MRAHRPQGLRDRDLDELAHFQISKHTDTRPPAPTAHWSYPPLSLSSTRGERDSMRGSLQPIYMRPLSCFVLFFLAPLSCEAVSHGKPKQSGNEILKYSLRKTLTHTSAAIMRGSDQAALALADKPTHQTNPANLREFVACSRPPASPYIARSGECSDLPIRRNGYTTPPQKL